MRVLLLLIWFWFLPSTASANDPSDTQVRDRLQQAQLLKALGYPTSGFESLDRCALELISAHQEKMFRGSREVQVGLVEQQVSQLQNLVSDWQHIPKGQTVSVNQSSYAEFRNHLRAMQSALNRLSTKLLQVQWLAHQAAATLDASAETKQLSAEDELLVHDLLNVLSVASYSGQYLELYISSEDPLSEDSISTLRQQLVRVELVLLRVSILAHSFTEALPKKRLSTVPISAIVEELSILFAGTVNTDSLTAEDKQIALLMDRDGLIRSVANLRKNALDARPGDAAFETSPIQIQLRIERVGYASGLILDRVNHVGVKTIVFLGPPLPELYFVVEVQDNAGGIALDRLNRTFEKGFSGHEGMQRGLGLFSVAREMERIDGSIRLSTTGSGTSVELAFPIRSSPRLNSNP
jgi:signal transduction histidine kinase